MSGRIETRVTDWRACVGGPWYPALAHGGLVAYRIWTQHDGLRWFQRHEWKCADGTIHADDWINGYPGWCANSTRVMEAS